MLTKRHNKMCLQGCCGDLLIAVVVKSIIAAEGGESPEADSVREKDLSASIDPDLNETQRFFTVREIQIQL